MPDSVLVVRTYAGADVWAADDGRVRGGDVAAIEAALEPHGATLEPLAGEAAQRLLTRPAGMRERADMACYFGVRMREPASDDLLDRLRDTAAVEFAYVKPPVAVRVAPPSAVGFEPAEGPEPEGPPEDLSSRQGYLYEAPAGIGAAGAWARPGGRGENVWIVDVEADWRFSHEDFHHNRGGLIAGRPERGDVERRNHGTSVMGMLAAVHNGRGVNGICPDAVVRGVSYEPEDPWGTTRAIKLAADALRPGDILLLEMMRPGPRTPQPGDPEYTPTTTLGFLPVEYWPSDMTAIQYAVSQGVIVVEAAGNGYQHLDDEIYGGRGPSGFRDGRPNPFARQELDSGAILIGAGAPPPDTHGRTHGPDRSRLDYSNWGTAIDAQGWGYEVTTTGGIGSGPDELRPGPFEDRWYTDRFNGTSSAAPMVAGALACVQGMLRAARRAPLTPEQARLGLRETGSEQTGPDEPIGTRPDISELFEWALHAPPIGPRSPRRRRRPMRVTITIDDDDTAWPPPGTQLPHVRGPHVRGPSLVLPREDGSETEIAIDDLKAAIEKSKKDA